jgi:hypothetical protein
MYEWNLTMIYRAMANAPISKLTDEGLDRLLTDTADAAAAAAGGKGWGWNTEPDYWLRMGLRAGPSIRFYGNPYFGKIEHIESFAQGTTFEVGFHAMLQVHRFLGVQTELIFTMDNAKFHYAEIGPSSNGGDEIKFLPDQSKARSLMIPVIVKGTFRPGRFLIAPLAGIYFAVPLGTMTGTSFTKASTGTYNKEPYDEKYKYMPVSAGFTAGLELGMRLGPGSLLFDARYSKDFGYATPSGQNGAYSRSMVSFSLGYEFNIFRKFKSKEERADWKAESAALKAEIEAIKQR